MHICSRTSALKVETWVELAPELVPAEYQHIKRPCVRLWRSLYGHPESGFHWNERFKAVMSQLGAVPLPSFPSNYWLPSFGLMLSLYVDDIVVSGPAERHEPFWNALQEHLELDPPTDVSRVLGRGHEISRKDNVTTCSFEMVEFVENACQMYEELTGWKLKPAASPYLPEGSLTDLDWAERGQFSQQASRILMKIFMGGALSAT